MNSLKYLVLIAMLFLQSAILIAQEEFEVLPSPPPPYFQLSPAEEQEYLKNINSELKLKLKEIKESNKERYADLLRELHWKNMEHSFMHMGKEKEMMKNEKQIVEYEILTESLALEYKSATSSGKTNIKKELQKNLSNLFDLKEMQRETEVKLLEDQIKKLKEKIATRKNNKDIIIRRRTEELLGEDKYLEWE